MKLYDSNGKEYQIDDSKEITRGGEGKIIKVDNNLVAKVYLPGITPINESRFHFLNSLNKKEFIKPESLLYNKNKKIEGYLMKLLPSNFYPLYSAFAPNFAKKASITDKTIIDMFKKMREIVEYCHSIGIVVGDLNPFNILMNDSGEFYFLDVDSYEVPGFKHSGRLLDDIRDHLYNGEVSKNSDYFAFSVNLFNTLTYIHPFRGIHKKIPSLAERMILKKSVLTPDPDLIIPKCYLPIKDKHLLNQFDRIFKGERFLISFDQNTQTYVISYKPTNVTIKHDKLNIVQMLDNETILDMSCSNKVFGVVTNKRVIIYDVSSKGYFRHIYEQQGISCRIFVTDKHSYIYNINTGEFKHIDNNGKIEDIKNVKLKNSLYLHQYDNILVDIKEDEIYKINLDMYMMGNVQLTTDVAFGYGFTNSYSLVQNISGTSNIFYEKNGTLNHVKFPIQVKDVFQNKNIGVARYIKNSKVEHSLFRINGLNVELSGRPISNVRSLAVKEGAFIIIPEDDKLTFLRPLDFTEMYSYECDLVNDYTQVFLTEAGIIIANDDNIHLLNKKI